MKLSPNFLRVLGVVALAAIAFGSVYAYGQQQFKRGQVAEKAAWLKRDNQALAKANARIVELNDKARATERQHQIDMAAASATYQKGLSNVKADRDRTVADLRSGALRLRIQLAAAATGAGGSEAGQAGAGSIGRDGETTAELSGAAGEFLVGLASEADEVVEQLTACQAVVESDRKTQGE